MLEHIPFINYSKTVPVTLFLIFKIVLQVLADLCVILLSENVTSLMCVPMRLQTVILARSIGVFMQSSLIYANCEKCSSMPNSHMPGIT